MTAHPHQVILDSLPKHYNCFLYLLHPTYHFSVHHESQTFISELQPYNQSNYSATNSPGRGGNESVLGN